MGIYVASRGLQDWKEQLRCDEARWKRRESAFELAVAWMHGSILRVPGMPVPVAKVLTGPGGFRSVETLFAIAGHKVKGSRLDLWALANSQQGLVSMSIAAQAGEGFGITVNDRLEQLNNHPMFEFGAESLCHTLAIDCEAAGAIRYVLLHRAAAAVIEAKRTGAPHAVMLVQCFGGEADHFHDFEALGRELGMTVRRNSVVQGPELSGISLWLAWVDCPPATGETLETLVKRNKVSAADAELEGADA